MKTVRFYFCITIISLSFFFCTSNNSDLTSSLQNVDEATTLLKPPSNSFNIIGGIFWWSGNYNSSIHIYSPSGYGWQVFATGILNPNGIDIANRYQYSIKVAILTRTNLVGIKPNYNELNNAVNENINWILIDDALTGNFTGAGIILPSTMEQIDSVAAAHQKYVVVCEDCSTVYESGEMDSNWVSFYQNNVDIIMPYGYDRNLAQLTSFYNYIQSKNKLLVPLLGYNVLKGSARYNQLGNRGNVDSGEQGFIETAHQYAWQNYVFYYYEDNSNPSQMDLSFLNSLSDYLVTNNYLKGVLMP